MNHIALAILVLLAGCTVAPQSAAQKGPADEAPSLMEMNSPSYLIEHSGPWVRDSSAHFRYFFFEGVTDLIEKVKAAQEVNYRYIARRMGVAADSLPTVNYFLFRDKDEKIRKTKVGSDAHALPDYASHLPTNATGGP